MVELDINTGNRPSILSRATSKTLKIGIPSTQPESEIDETRGLSTLYIMNLNKFKTIEVFYYILLCNFLININDNKRTKILQSFHEKKVYC